MFPYKPFLLLEFLMLKESISLLSGSLEWMKNLGILKDLGIAVQ